MSWGRVAVSVGYGVLVFLGISYGLFVWESLPDGPRPFPGPSTFWNLLLLGPVGGILTGLLIGARHGGKMGRADIPSVLGSLVGQALVVFVPLGLIAISSSPPPHGPSTPLIQQLAAPLAFSLGATVLTGGLVGFLTNLQIGRKRETQASRQSVESQA